MEKNLKWKVETHRIGIGDVMCSAQAPLGPASLYLIVKDAEVGDKYRCVVEDSKGYFPSPSYYNTIKQAKEFFNMYCDTILTSIIKGEGNE